jgi:hypothetical protein
MRVTKDEGWAEERWAKERWAKVERSEGTEELLEEGKYNRRGQMMGRQRARSR